MGRPRLIGGCRIVCINLDGEKWDEFLNSLPKKRTASLMIRQFIDDYLECRKPGRIGTSGQAGTSGS